MIARLFALFSLLFPVALAACSQATIMPGREFFQDENCRVYETVLSGFQSGVPSFYVMCNEEEPFEVFTTSNVIYYDVEVERLLDVLQISVDYCNAGEGTRALHAEDVEPKFRARFDGAEFGGLRLTLDFHEEPSGCFEDRTGFPWPPVER